MIIIFLDMASLHLQIPAYYRGSNMLRELMTELRSILIEKTVSTRECITNYYYYYQIYQQQWKFLTHFPAVSTSPLIPHQLLRPTAHKDTHSRCNTTSDNIIIP